MDAIALSPPSSPRPPVASAERFLPAVLQWVNTAISIVGTVANILDWARSQAYVSGSAYVFKAVIYISGFITSLLGAIEDTYLLLNGKQVADSRIPLFGLIAKILGIAGATLGMLSLFLNIWASPMVMTITSMTSLGFSTAASIADMGIRYVDEESPL